MTEKARNNLRSSFEFLGDVKFYLDEAMKHEEEEMERMKIRCIITEVGKLMDKTFELAKHESTEGRKCDTCLHSRFCSKYLRERSENCTVFEKDEKS